MKKLNLNININSLDEFYRECDNIEGGNPAEIDNIENHDDPGFRGLSTAEIHDSKYSYTKGLDNLKKIEKEHSIIIWTDYKHEMKLRFIYPGYGFKEV